MLAACRRDARTNGGGAGGGAARLAVCLRRRRDATSATLLNSIVGICSTMTLLLLGVSACLPYTAGEQKPRSRLRRAKPRFEHFKTRFKMLEIGFSNVEIVLMSLKMLETRLTYKRGRLPFGACASKRPFEQNSRKAQKRSVQRMPIATPGRPPAFWGRGRKPHFEQRKVQVLLSVYAHIYATSYA